MTGELTTFTATDWNPNTTDGAGYVWISDYIYRDGTGSNWPTPWIETVRLLPDPAPQVEPPAPEPPPLLMPRRIRLRDEPKA